MLQVGRILGSADEPRFAGRRRERLSIAYDEACKRRLRRRTDAGTDVAIDVSRGEYLAEGSVLHDDGERIVVVARRRVSALVVRFADGLPADALVSQAVRLGHAFGNQHVPVETNGLEVRIPLTTSEQIARTTVAALGLPGIEVAVAPVALGRERPLAAGHAHGGGPAPGAP